MAPEADAAQPEWVVRSNRDGEIVVRCGDDEQLAHGEAERLDGEQRHYHEQAPINSDSLAAQGMTSTLPTTYRVEFYDPAADLPEQPGEEE